MLQKFPNHLTSYFRWVISGFERYAIRHHLCVYQWTVRMNQKSRELSDAMACVNLGVADYMYAPHSQWRRTRMEWKEVGGIIAYGSGVYVGRLSIWIEHAFEGVDDVAHWSRIPTPSNFSATNVFLLIWIAEITHVYVVLRYGSWRNIGDEWCRVGVGRGSFASLGILVRGCMEMLVKYIIPAWQCNSLIWAPPVRNPGGRWKTRTGGHARQSGGSMKVKGGKSVRGTKLQTKQFAYTSQAISWSNALFDGTWNRFRGDLAVRRFYTPKLYI